MRCGRKWLGLIGLLLLPGACRKSEAPGSRAGDAKSADAGIDLRVDLGTAGRWASDRRALLRVEITNREQDIRGHLDVTGILPGGGRDPVTLRRPLDVPGHAVREVHFAIRPAIWEAAEIRVVSPDRRVGMRYEIPAPRSDGDSGADVLVIGDRTPGLTALAHDLRDCIRVARIARIERAVIEEDDDDFLYNDNDDGADDTLETWNAMRLQSQAVPIGPRDLPAHPAGYDPFHLVVLHGASLSTARPEAVEALARWVESGGTLVAFPGAEWASGLPPRLEGLLGLTLGDPLAAVPEPLASLVTAGDHVGTYRALRPGPASTVLRGGLAVRARPGVGYATTFSVTPGGSDFPTPEDAPDIYAILRAAFVRSDAFAGSADVGLGEVEGRVTTPLFAMTGFRIPEGGLVFFAIFVYLIVGFFVPFAIFRHYRKREWIFASASVTAAIAIFAIYRYGLLSAIDHLQNEEISIVRVHADGSAAEVTSYVSIVSPAFRQVDIGPLMSADENVIPHATASPVRYGGTDGSMATEVQREMPATRLDTDELDTVRIAPFTLYPNGPRLFRFDYRIAENLPVVVRVERNPDDDEDTLIIQNPSERRVTTLLVADERYAAGPTLEPGEDVRFTWLRRVAGDGHAWSPRADGLPEGAWHWVGKTDLAGNITSHAAGQAIRQALALSVATVALPYETRGEFLDVVVDRHWFDDAERADAEPMVQSRHPRYLIAWSKASVFPGARSIPRHEAVTIAVYELPPVEEAR